MVFSYIFGHNKGRKAGVSVKPKFWSRSLPAHSIYIIYSTQRYRGHFSCLFRLFRGDCCTTAMDCVSGRMKFSRRIDVVTECHKLMLSCAKRSRSAYILAVLAVWAVRMMRWQSLMHNASTRSTRASCCRFRRFSPRYHGKLQWAGLLMVAERALL